MEKNFSQQNQSPPTGQFTYDPEKNSAKSKSILIQPPSINLPKGGSGSIKSIDEKFKVNSSNGTSSFTIPFPITPGRNNFNPTIELTYNSGSGNSSFGLGFQLNISSIQRRTEKKYPLYRDDEDVFQISGAEDLVPSEKQSLNSDSKLYHPRIESGFSRIEKVGKGKDTFWRVTDRNNVVSIFGKNPLTKIVDPADDSRIFRWLIDYSFDDKGNAIRYQYRHEDLQNITGGSEEANRGATNVTNLYPHRVLYGNDQMFPSQQSEIGALQFHFEVVFDYGEKGATLNLSGGWASRQDIFSMFSGGFDIRNYRLCRRIYLIHHFESELGVKDYLVKSLDLEYHESKRFSYLTSATIRGYVLKDGKYESEATPPFSFEYQGTELNLQLSDIADAVDNFGITRDQWVDLYSEGIQGRLSEYGGGLYYRSNLGNGKFSPAKLVSPKPAFVGLHEGTIQIQDIESNGIKSLVVRTNSVEGYFDLNEEGAWQEFHSFARQLSIDLNDPSVLQLDIDGDDVPDLLISEDKTFRIYHNKGKQGYDEPSLIPAAADEENGPITIFTDASQAIVVSPMSGSGSAIVRIRNGEISYWTHLGHGRFSKKVTMANSPWFDAPDQFNPKHVKLGDFDGSGTPDVCYYSGSTDQLKIWYNESGNSWSNVVELDNPFPPIDDETSLEIIDLLGIGTSCLVWKSQLPKYECSPMRYVDLYHGKKPNIISRISNNHGKEISIEYRSSTQYYLDDLKAGKKWITNLPFPVQCVSKVEVRDYISETRFTSVYSYHHGYYDSVDKEFRGFSRVEQIDSEGFKDFVLGTRQANAFNDIDPELFQKPIKTITWHHTGAYLRGRKIVHQLVDEYSDKKQFLPEPSLPDNLSSDELIEAHRSLKGQMLRQEVYDLNDRNETEKLYSITEANYLIQLLQPKKDKPYGVLFSMESEKVTINVEGKPADARIAHELNIEIDKYGTVLKSATVVYPRKSGSVHADQSKQFVTFAQSGVIHIDSSADGYRIGLPYEKKDYELRNVKAQQGALYSVAEIAEAIKTSGDLPYFEWDNKSTEPLKRIIEYKRVKYRSDDATTILPFGTADTKALAHETYVAAFDDLLFKDIFNQHVATSFLTNECRYLSDGGFYWLPSGTITYNPDKFFRSEEYTDALGEVSKVAYDAHSLMAVRAEDAAENVNEVVTVNYRVVSPMVMKDPNDNLSAVRYDPLGRVTGLFLIGKTGTDRGDVFQLNSLEPHINDKPSLQFEYHTDSWFSQLSSPGFRKGFDLPQPGFVKTIAHEVHPLYNGGDYATKTIISFTYSDGSGHEVLTKVQAETGNAPVRDENDGLMFNADGTVLMKADQQTRWVGNGKKIVNNKQNVVKAYDPYFDCTHKYNGEKELRHLGVTPVLYYDAAGRLVKTVKPNKTFSKVVFDNWKQEIWDENDTVIESDWYKDGTNSSDQAERAAAEKASKHANTPSVIHLDSLAKPFLMVASDGRTQTSIETYVRYDVEGNIRSVTDDRGNEVMTWKYDMLGNMCFQKSMDAGERWTLMNTMTKPILKKDDRSHVFSFKYDKLHRPLEGKVKGGEKVILDNVFDSIIYGESIADAKKRNLRGKPAIHYDTGGKLAIQNYDFKGNLTESHRWLCSDYRKIPNWAIQNKESLLEKVNDPFTIKNEYDALNRIVRSIAPDGSETIPAYNKANLLDAVDVKFANGTRHPIVTDIAYNAKAQRESITYGNEVTTQYEYDPDTLWLKKLTSRKENNSLLQLLKYTYDPVGNITQIVDEAIPTKFFSNFIVEPVNEYEYDALYRLINATGREHIAQVDFGKEDNWNDLPFLKRYDPGNDMQIRPYLQSYEYDVVGNITKMIHSAGTGSWTRTYKYEDNNNRLKTTQIGDGELYTYPHHPKHGFIESMPHLPSMTWNFKDELASTSRQVKNNGTPETTYYVYDSSGTRIRKVTDIEANGTDEAKKKDERIYLGSYELYVKYKAGNLVDHETRSLHVMDDKSRVALIEKESDSALPLIRFQLNDHLGSSCLELDEKGIEISHETFYPFGSTSLHAVNAKIKAAAKRYRFTAMERDEQNGLEYHNSRFYCNWLGRWLSADRIGIKGGINRYSYVSNNSTNKVDPMGEEEEKPKSEDTTKKIAETMKEVHRKAVTIQTNVIIPAKLLAEYNKAKTVLSVYANQIRELKLMNKALTKLTNLANRSGGGQKIQAQIKELQQGIAKAQELLAEQKNAVRAANKLIQGVRTAAQELRGFGALKDTALTKLAGLSLRFAKFLEATAIGRGVLKIGGALANPVVQKALMVVAAVAAGVHSYADSTNRTTTGKVTNAVLGAGTGALVMANPMVALADHFAPKGYKVSEVYHGGSNAVTAIGEGLITGDTSAMEDFHARSKKGDFGKVMKLSSEAGDYWAEKGIGGGLKEFGREVWNLF